MRQYILCIITVSVAAGIAGLLIPEKDGGATKKVFNLLAALCVICVLIEPAGKLVGAVSDMKSSFEEMLRQGDTSGERSNNTEHYESIFGQTTEYIAADELKKDIFLRLHDRFGISKEDAEVKVIFADNEEIRLEAVEIQLHGTALFKNPYEIEDYFFELYDCRVSVR